MTFYVGRIVKAHMRLSAVCKLLREKDLEVELGEAKLAAGGVGRTMGGNEVLQFTDLTGRLELVSHQVDNSLQLTELTVWVQMSTVRTRDDGTRELVSLAFLGEDLCARKAKPGPTTAWGFGNARVQASMAECW